QRPLDNMREDFEWSILGRPLSIYKVLREREKSCRPVRYRRGSKQSRRYNESNAGSGRRYFFSAPGPTETRTALQALESSFHCHRRNRKARRAQETAGRPVAPQVTQGTPT